MPSAHKAFPELKREHELLEEERNRIFAEYLMTDLEISLTFARSALNSGDDALHAERNRRNARRGYDSVVHFKTRLRCSDLQRRELQLRLKELRSLLEKAGESF